MNRKSAFRVVVTEVITMVPNILHPYSNSVVTTLSPLSPYYSLLMPNMWHFSWSKILSLYMTVVFLV